LEVWIFIYTLKLFRILAEIGLPGTATYAQTLSGLEEMLNVLPDNAGNLISARDMRDVVYTLYDNVQTASFSEFLYTDTPSTVEVGGVPRNTQFASMSLFTIFNKLFHKDYDPSASLSFVGIGTITTFDYKGRGTDEYINELTIAGVPNPIVAASSPFDLLISYELKWTATKATYNFKPDGTITRSPAPSPPEVTQAGDPLFDVFVPALGGTNNTGTTNPVINVSNSYTFTCYDTRNVPASAPASLSYGVRWYWGRVSSRNPLTSAQIRALDGAGVSGNGSFGTTFRKTYTTDNGGQGLDPLGNYIAWAWPSAWGVSADPIWNQKAGPSGFATKIQSKFNFVNKYGYSVEYDVWISKESYGSKLDYLQIA
jgi:hypothetical protein